MTHRALSRNAASSRAIPILKVIDDVKKNPARPVHWGRNQKGMAAHEALDAATAVKAIRVWDEACLQAIESAEKLLNLGVHKQVANRLLEPFVHMQTLVTATDLDNFFALRAHPDTQPEFQVLAFETLEAYVNSTPQVLNPGDWHIPFSAYIPPELETALRLKVATARAARVSYKTFYGKINLADDYVLHDRLRDSGHWSPFEHCAQSMETRDRSGNLVGWRQYRKLFAGECRNVVDHRALLDMRTHFNWEDYQAELAA